MPIATRQIAELPKISSVSGTGLVKQSDADFYMPSETYSMIIIAVLTGFVSSLASAETYPDLNGCYRCFNNNCSNSNQYAKIEQNSPGDLVFYNERRPSLTSSGKFISQDRVMAYSYRSIECGPPMTATLSYYPTATLNWCSGSVWVKQVSCD